MKRTKVFLSTLLALSILFSAGAAAADISFKEKSGIQGETFKIVVDEQADPATVAKENATAKEVYLPASYGYRVPDDTSASGEGESFDSLFPDARVVVDEPASPEIIAAENAKEVYLDPVQIDENTYEYYDEDGVLFGTLVTGPEAASEILSATRADPVKYQLNWQIPAKDKTHGTQLLDSVIAVAEIHHNVTCLNSTLTFVGYYGSGDNTYHWINPPSSSKLDGYFLLGSAHKVYFALKNDGNTLGYYGGTYWVEY